MPGSALKELSAEELANAARQLQYALDGSASTDEAFQKLYAAVDARQRDHLRQLENLLRSSESDAAPGESLRLSAFPTLAWLLRQTVAPARSAAALFAEFRRHQSFSAAGIVAVWSDFSGYLTYLAAVLGVLMVVTGLFTVLVLPQFKSLYSGFGEDLPVVTSAFFGHRSAVFTLMSGVALGPDRAAVVVSVPPAASAAYATCPCPRGIKSCCSSARLRRPTINTSGSPIRDYCVLPGCRRIRRSPSPGLA